MKNKDISELRRPPPNSEMTSEFDDENSEVSQALIGRLKECEKAVGGANQLAQLSAIPKRTLSTYLAGTAKLNLPRAAAIAKAAGKSLDWLAGVEVNISEPPEAYEAMDRELLAQIIEAMAEGIERSGWALRPAEWARLVLLWYDELSKLQKADPKAHILSFYPDERATRPGAPDKDGAGDDEIAPD
jgi:transcriptional regulator with XRE-family HTH domain